MNLYLSLDIILFAMLSACVLYFVIFGIYAKRYTPNLPSPTNKRHKFYVIFPAYKADQIIISSVTSFFNQEYPKEDYTVVVVADGMTESTCQTLRELGARVLVANYKDSTKAKALSLAMSESLTVDYDLAVIMDADNMADPHFLQELNKMYSNGSRAIQAHRMAKNLNTDIARLDAASEEINNSIFRSGHVAAGLSCGLIGSGMAFDFCWFKKHVTSLHTAGEDKELEALLLKEKIKIDYVSWVNILDEKTQGRQAITQQRRRWIAAQYASLSQNLPYLGQAIKERNFSYIDKIIQWMLPPRLIQIGALLFFTLLTTIIGLYVPHLAVLSIKWWFISIVQVAVFVMVLPKSLRNYKMLKSIVRLPLLIVITFINVFKLKGVNKKFIHTEHRN